MKINPNDYSSSKARTSALDALWEFGNELKVYFKRVLYALERACMQRDYFIGTQVYQDETLPVVEDGYHGYGDYESAMPNAIYPILAGPREAAGLQTKPAQGTKYTVGGAWDTAYVISDRTSGDHADAVYSNTTSIGLRYYATSNLTGSYLVGTLQPTLVNNAVASYTPTVPAGLQANPAYLLAYPDQIPRNAVFIEEGVASSQNPVDIETVFENKISSPATAWFGYYDDDATHSASITISLPIKQGIAASNYTAKIMIYEAIDNGYTPYTNLLNSYEYQATGTMLPTALTFTKNDIDDSVDHPIIIQIHHLTTA